jgi:chromosome segregation ATPase
MSTINDITNYENSLLNNLNDYNRIYTCYVYNLPNAGIFKKDIRGFDKPSFCTKLYSQGDVNAAMNKVNTDINNLKNALNNYRGTNQSMYLRKYDDLLSKYDDIISTRDDLDEKLAELYSTEDGIKNYYNNLYSTTMFSKLMLTILLTSLAYYTFMKMIKK